MNTLPTATVRNLENVEVIRHDPRDYFTIICNREESDGWWHHEWNKFELSENEYTVGDKTVRLSIIEDKRPGAQDVAPGLKFEIFDTNNILLASGNYTFTNLQYNANYDDYGNTDKYSFEFKANFEQVEVLGKTGILIVDTVMEYDFYN